MGSKIFKCVKTETYSVEAGSDKTGIRIASKISGKFQKIGPRGLFFMLRFRLRADPT
jgi:hypothetical protein